MADKSLLNLLRIRACDEGEWDESEHPRAKNGQFTSGGAGGGGASALKEVANVFKSVEPYKAKFGAKWAIVPDKHITKGIADKLNKETEKALAEVASRFNPSKDKLGKTDAVKRGDTVLKQYPEMQKRYDEIVSKEPQITADLMEIMKAQGGQFTGLDFRTKAAESLERKIGKNIADPKKEDINTPEEAINAMGDIIRYTAMSPSHDKLGETCNNVVAGLKKAGYHVVEVDNKWENPTPEGYRGLHLEVVTPDWSQHFELQIHSDEDLEIKQRQHPLYEITRDKKSYPEGLREQIKRVSIKMGIGLERPKGIEKLQSKENKDWRENHQDVA